MKKSELRQIIKEEISKAVNEFGPMAGPQNYSRKSSNPLVDKIGKLDSILMDTNNFKANMEWDKVSSEILDLNDVKYWEDLGTQELEDAINTAQSIIKKYNIREELSKSLKEQTNTGLITFEQLKQSCIESYKEYLEEYDSDEYEFIMGSFDEVVNMEELLDLLDGMGFNGNEAYDFIFDAILK
jgi:hypothetical protein